MPPGESRVVLAVNFKTSDQVDHNAIIHLVTEQGHVMRIPLYYHVYEDIIKFLPSVVDFGVVPMNFDALSLPVTLKIRNGHDISMLYLTEVMLPLNDIRLDFVMGEWDRDSRHHTKVFNKSTKMMEDRRQGGIYFDHEFHLMTVLMNPIRYGIIDTYVKLTF